MRMLLPKFIAVQAYLESTGTAFADMQYVEPLLMEMLQRKVITPEEGRELLGHKSDVAKTILNLLQHIGLIKSHIDKEDRSEFFSLTNFSRYILETKKEKQNIAQPLIPFFLTWLPFKIFLKYLQQTPGADLNDIRTNLGTQVLKHTAELIQVIQTDSIRRGAYIPFNEMVIEKVLANIGEYLGLISFEKSSGPYYLSPLGKYVTNSLDVQNFQFKNLDSKLNPTFLALMDFLDRGQTNIIAFGDPKGNEELKAFYRLYDEKVKIDHMVNIVYNVSNFTGLISLDSAFWRFTNLFSNITYDQIKVLEFNSKIMDYIQI